MSHPAPSHPLRDSVTAIVVLAAILAVAAFSYAFLVDAVASTLAGRHSPAPFASRWDASFEPR